MRDATKTRKRKAPAAVERRRLNILHAHGGKVVDITAIGHNTYGTGSSRGIAYWFFRAKVEWDDGSHARDPEHLYEVSPINLAFDTDRTDVDLALDAMNAYLAKNGRWADSKRLGRIWVPYEKKGEEEVTL